MHHISYLWPHLFFSHYLINGTIFEKKNISEYTMRVLIIFRNFVSNIFAF